DFIGVTQITRTGAAERPRRAHRVAGTGLIRDASARFIRIAAVSRPRVADRTGWRDGVDRAHRAHAVAQLIRIAEVARACVTQRAGWLDVVGRAYSAAARLDDIARASRGTAHRSVRVSRQTVVGHLIARFAAIGVTVGAATGIAGGVAARAARTGLGPS